MLYLQFSCTRNGDGDRSNEERLPREGCRCSEADAPTVEAHWPDKNITRLVILPQWMAAAVWMATHATPCCWKQPRKVEDFTKGGIWLCIRRLAKWQRQLFISRLSRYLSRKQRLPMHGEFGGWAAKAAVLQLR
ncbi:uncharacterized protein ISCGN_009782 [Ixodes scapularis]